MKKINSKVLKSFLVVGCSILIAFLIEIFGFQFKLLLLDKNIQQIVSIEYEESVVNDKKVIKIDLENMYVNKLRIDYKTEKDVVCVFKYMEKDYYNGIQENEMTDVFDNEGSQQITNFRNEIGELTISYDMDSEIVIESISVDNQLRLNYFRIIFISFALIAFYFIWYFYKNDGSNLNLYKYFILLGIFVGTTMIILQPCATYYSWDDQIHFSNVYQLGRGKLIWSIGEFSMIDISPIGRDSIDSLEEQEQRRSYLNEEEESDYYTDNGRFITYDKMVYIPSAVGYYGAKFLGLPFNICFMMGKFMNLLVYLLIIGYAIKIAKVGKRLLFVLGFIPTSLFLACQYSYDPAVISGFILATVCLINWFIDKKCKVNFKNLLIFIFSMLYSCFPKAVYIPFILLFLFVPTDRFQTKRQSVFVKIGVVAICVLMMSTFVLPVVSGGAITGDVRGGDTSVFGQLQVILKNPIGYIKVLSDTMIANFGNSFFGSGAIGSYAYMGNISNNLYMIFLILMLFVTFIDNSKLVLKKNYKLLFFIMILGVVLLIWTALYLSFTPIGLNTINGVQPRYFLPLLFPLLLCCKFANIEFKGSEKLYNFIVLLVVIGVSFASIYQLILVHYCF